MNKSSTRELGVGERIRIVRQQHRLNQAEMAEKLGMSVSQYSKIEVGLRNIGKEPLHILCKSFDVTSDFILYGSGAASTFSQESSLQGSASVKAKSVNLMDALEKIARELDLSFEAVSKCFSELANKKKNGELK